MSIVIEDFGVKDFPKVQQLIEQALLEADEDSLPSQSKIAELLSGSLTGAGLCVKLMKSGNNIVGILIGSMTTGFLVSDIYAISPLSYVLAEYQSQAEPLYQAFEQWGKSKGAEQIFLFMTAKQPHNIDSYKSSGLFLTKEV